MITYLFRCTSREENKVKCPRFTIDTSKNKKFKWCPLFFLPLPLKHHDSGPAGSQSHLRGIFLEIDGRFFFVIVFPPKPLLHPLFFFPPQVWQNTKRKQTPSVQQQCWLSQREERNRRNTLYPREVPLKAPFFMSDRKTSDWQDLTKSGRRDSVLLDTSSQGRRHFLFPVTTFSGGLYQSIASAQKGCPASPPAALQGGQARQFRSGSPSDVWSGSTGR